MKNRKNQEVPAVEATTIEAPAILSTEELTNQLIEDMATMTESTETPKGKLKYRVYNNPEFRSELMTDLTAVNFPIKWTSPKGEELVYENRFGDLKVGDFFSMELIANNVNTLPIGKITGFKIQTNGCWIRYEAYNKKPYWKNLNLFKGLATEADIAEFAAARKAHFEQLEAAKTENK